MFQPAPWGRWLDLHPGRHDWGEGGGGWRSWVRERDSDVNAGGAEPQEEDVLDPRFTSLTNDEYVRDDGYGRATVMK